MSDVAAQDRATRRLRRFAQQQNGDLRLAQHAALPVVLSPELLHLIRINFLLDEKNAAPPPFTAEVDLLLSPLCREIGDGLYEINPEAREILLRDLVANPRYGRGRLHEIASLLWQYSHRAPTWADRPGLHRAQQLTALNILDPQQAVAWLADAQAQAGHDAQVDEEWFLVMAREHEAALAALNVAPVDRKQELTDDQARAYERGIAVLDALLPAGDERARQLAVYAERLRAALAAERAYGATATARAEREAIVAQIDTLTRTSLGRSFEELCQAEAGQIQPPPLTDEERAELRQLRETYQRRLRLLEQQEARFGIQTPPHILIDIQDLRERLLEIERRLGQSESDTVLEPGIPDVEAVPVDVAERELIQQRDAIRRRLFELELRAAQYGYAVEPATITEIEDLRGEIARVEARLQKYMPTERKQTVASLDAAEREHLQQLRTMKLRRLQLLEQRQAQQGDLTSLDVLSELVDIRTDISRIDAQLGQSTQPAEPGQLLELLASHRQDLAQLLARQAQYIGSTQPLDILNAIENHRGEIRRIKHTLRAADVAVEDLPNDEAPAVESTGDTPTETVPPEATSQSDTILQLGIDAAREGNREEARNLFALLTRQEPDNAQAWLWLAGVAEGPEQRRAALERVLELDPTNQLAIKGLQAMSVEVPPQAETPSDDFETIESLLDGEPVQPEPTSTRLDFDETLQRGIEYAREGNRDVARDVFSQLTRQYPDNAQGWLWLAGVAANRDERRAALERVLELDPTNEMAIKGLQVVKFGGWAANAMPPVDVNDVRKVRRPSEEADTATILELGLEASKDGMREEAYNLFSLATRRAPDDIQAWLLKAWVSTDNADRRDALERVLQLDPGNESARVGLEAMGLASPPPRSNATTTAPRREITDEDRNYAAELDSAFADYDELSPTLKPATAPRRKTAEPPPRRKMTDEELQRVAAQLDSASDYEALSSPRLPGLGETFSGTILSIVGNKVRVEIPGVPEYEAIGELEVGFARRMLMRKGSSVRVTVVQRVETIRGSSRKARQIVGLKLA